MLQISAAKLLYVSRQTLLTAVNDIEDKDWFWHPPGMNSSYEWVLGHYAAVEDWFMHYLNGTPKQLSDDWYNTYWSDTSAPVTVETGAGRGAVTATFEATRERLLKALLWDLLHPNRFVKKGVFPPKVRTRGDAWLFISAHSYWHIGQVMALRMHGGYPYTGGKGIHR